jgi:hypothetical protein
MKDIKLFSSDLQTITDIVEPIHVTEANIVKAKKPIFEGLFNLKVQCLLAVGIGCDVFVPGVPTFTPKVLFDFITKLKEKYDNDDIIDLYINHYKLYMSKMTITLTNNDVDGFRNMINVFVNTMMYEPTNYNILDENGYIVPSTTPTTYINNNYVPSRLHQYIKAFACGDTAIVIYPETTCPLMDMSICSGPGNGTHVFLSCKGHSTCKDCGIITCKTCTSQKKARSIV